MSRGYFGIGMYAPTKSVNLGTLWRHAYCFGASFIFTIGAKYRMQSSDVMKAWRHVPYFPYPELENFLACRPYGAPIVAIEMLEGAKSLETFTHPERAVYVLGPENGTLGQKVFEHCAAVVRIPSQHCLNVAGAGTIVMYDRKIKCLMK